MSIQKVTVVVCDVTDCKTTSDPDHFDGIRFRVTHSNWSTITPKTNVDLCPKHAADLRNLLKLPKD
jgi:hypothetical protein